MDYKKFYDDERFLLDEVGPNFRRTGELDAIAFYMLLNWKAPRAKNYAKKRLKAKAGSFKAGVRKLADDLHKAATNKRRLKILMEYWEFSLPTATAILAILFPADNTVFDWRVCDQVGVDYKPWNQRAFSDALWQHYETFKQAVIDQVPSETVLREKDRFLIGRSIYEELEKVCAE